MCCLETLIIGQVFFSPHALVPQSPAWCLFHRSGSNSKVASMGIVRSPKAHALKHLYFGLHSVVEGKSQGRAHRYRGGKINSLSEYESLKSYLHWFCMQNITLCPEVLAYDALTSWSESWSFKYR